MEFLHESRSSGMVIPTIDGILEPSGSNKILVVPWADDGVDIIQARSWEMIKSLDNLRLAPCIRLPILPRDSSKILYMNVRSGAWSAVQYMYHELILILILTWSYWFYGLGGVEWGPRSEHVISTHPDGMRPG